MLLVSLTGNPVTNVSRILSDFVFYHKDDVLFSFQHVLVQEFSCCALLVFSAGLAPNIHV